MLACPHTFAASSSGCSSRETIERVRFCTPSTRYRHFQTRCCPRLWLIPTVCMMYENHQVGSTTPMLTVALCSLEWESFNGHPTFRCAQYGTWLSHYGVRVRIPNGKLIFRLPHDEFRLLHHVVLMRIPNGNPTFRLPKSNFRLLHYGGFTENP